MHIVKLENCTLCIICTSFSFVHAPVCANLVIIYYSKKKKKEKKRKTTRTLVWVKIPKLCHKKNPTIYLFSLGKGGNPYISKLYLKTKLSALSALPSNTLNIFDSNTVWMTHAKIDQKIHFFCKFQTFPVTEGYAI